jgi:hypothetical protein
MVCLVRVCCRKWKKEAVLELQGGMQEIEAACMCGRYLAVESVEEACSTTVYAGRLRVGFPHPTP